MGEQEQRALLALVLMAARADAAQGGHEQAAIARVVTTLSQLSSLDVQRVHDDVQHERITIAQAAAALTTPDTRKAAYEACAAVCAADGVHDASEQAFLVSLATALGFDAGARAMLATFSTHANALAAAPVTPGANEPLAEAAAGSAATADARDRMILNYAILNGALELFPDTLSSMAILPLQMRMVYRIGQSYGITLDKDSIKELLATAGIGLTSQYVEQLGVSLLGRLFGRGLLGGLLGLAAQQAVSTGFSFATTYALGRLAVRYYAGGRNWSPEVLKTTYQELLQEARRLEGQHFSEIQEKARTVNVREIMKDALA